MSKNDQFLYAFLFVVVTVWLFLAGEALDGE